MRGRSSGRALLVLLLLLAVGAGLVLWYRRSRPGPELPELPAPDPNEIRVALSGRPAGLPVTSLKRLPQVGSARIVVVPVPDPGMRWQMLAAGQLDLVLSTLDEFALAVPRHNPGVLLFPTAFSQGSDVVVGQGSLSGPDDLSGKRIAVVRGAGGEYLVLSYLSGHPQVGYTLVPALDIEQARRWLAAGDVQAAVLWEPYASQALERGGRPLWTSSSVRLTDVWVASRQALSAKGEQMRSLATAWFTLVRKMRQQPGLAYGAVAEESGLDRQRLELALRGLKFLELEEARQVTSDDLVAVLDDMVTLWSLAGAANARRVNYQEALDLELRDSLELPGESLLPSPEPLEGGPEAPPEETLPPAEPSPQASPGKEGGSPPASPAASPAPGSPGGVASP
jgi:ABC-type nitrate/sulfonate/bicarbonate transport system substrate-binding protein